MGRPSDLFLTAHRQLCKGCGCPRSRQHCSCGIRNRFPAVMHSLSSEIQHGKSHRLLTIANFPLVTSSFSGHSSPHLLSFHGQTSNVMFHFIAASQPRASQFVAHVPTIHFLTAKNRLACADRLPVVSLRDCRAPFGALAIPQCNREARLKHPPAKDRKIRRRTSWQDKMQIRHRAANAASCRSQQLNCKKEQVPRSCAPRK